MSSPNDIDPALDELLPQDSAAETGEQSKLEGKFQIVSSLAGYLGLYKNLTNPGKEELLSALYDLGIRNAAGESVFDFLQVDGETTKGYIRSKNGEWIEQNIDEFPDGDLAGDYGVLAKLASFLGLYEMYGLDGPSGEKLRQALVNYGVVDVPETSNKYLAPLEDTDGEEHLIGIETGAVTTAYPVDADGNRIGDDEYTRDLLPNLSKRLASSTHHDGDMDEFVSQLPDDLENLLENEQVAENYQLIMHRLAAQAAAEGVTESIRSKKLAEARFITEVLSGERTWE